MIGNTVTTAMTTNNGVRLPPPSESTHLCPLRILTTAAASPVSIDGLGVSIVLQPGEQADFVVIDARERSDQEPQLEWRVKP